MCLSKWGAGKRCGECSCCSIWPFFYSL